MCRLDIVGYPSSSGHIIFNGAHIRIAPLFSKTMCTRLSDLMWQCWGCAFCLPLLGTALCAGDFVDRGAWGLETLIVLSALKLAAPQHVSLLRGNHESSTCTQLYGFRTEVFRKYGTEVSLALSCVPLCQFPALHRYLNAWAKYALSPEKDGIWRSDGRSAFSRQAS